MQFSREINRLLMGVLAAFVIVALAAGYWAITGADTILRRADNPRLVEAEVSIQRGSIFDRNGEVLVESSPDENGAITRHYLYPDIYSALGYFSLRYGVSGAEAAYDALLRGSDETQSWNTFLSTQLLHQAQVGSDVRLTFDHFIQEQLAASMGDKRGAAVVLAVPSGEVLAMISLPTYDPNTLDANWEALTRAPGNPFFNRVLQGNYQPGGTLQSVMMAAAILARQPLDETIPSATRPIELRNIEIGCAVMLAPQALTLREAYAFGCPYPFEQLGQTLGLETVQAVFDTFQLGTPPILPGYLTDANETRPTPIASTSDHQQWIDNVLGQGNLTITPLQMVMIAGAIVNDGNAPQPYTLMEVLRPGATNWDRASDLHPSIPMMTANTARQLQDLMRLAVANGAAQNAGRPNIDIGGHATIAYSGNESQVWFIGFSTLGGREGIAVAVVLENSSDPGLAADIGGTVLETAHSRLQSAP